MYHLCKIEDLKPAYAKKNIVVSVGRISLEREREITLQLAKHLPSMRFIITGLLESKRYYRRLLSNKPPNVTILTNLSREKLRRLLAISKVYFNPHSTETFGRAIVEGMASGCVPVVPDSGSIPEIATNKCGYRYHSLEEATDYVKEVITDNMVEKAKSIKAVERSKLFTPEMFKLRIIRALKKIASKE